MSHIRRNDNKFQYDLLSVNQPLFLPQSGKTSFLMYAKNADNPVEPGVESKGKMSF